MPKSTRPTILVLGSLGRSTTLVPSKKDPNMFLRKEGWVGAPLLREMICQSLVELQDDPKRSIEQTESCVTSALDEIRRRVLPAPPELEPGGLQDVCVKITSVFKQLNKTSTPKDRAAVLRVASHYTSQVAKAEELEPFLTKQMNAAVTACRDPDVLVLFDFDKVSRRIVKSNLRRLRAGAGRRFTVLGFAGEIRGDALDWLPSLTPDVTGGPDRTVAVVRAEELRKAGLIIIESGPIERTVRDLFRHFTHKPLSIMVRKARHLVILFEEVGAVYARLGASRQGSIHLSSNSDEIAIENHDRYGRAPGRMSITLAAIARQLSGAAVREGIPDLSPAVRLSLAAFNRYFTEGYDAKEPLSTLESTLSYESCKQLKALVEGQGGQKPDKAYFMSSLDFPMNRSALNRWTRLDEALTKQDGDKAERLRRIVKQGPEATFRNDKAAASSGPWYPRARILCPYMQIGDLKTFDEEEIAGFTSLTKVFRKYLQTPGWKAPLSIAVFGPPGTGKSFGVRELMKSINPAAEKELTFNLSQLKSVDALNDAFHDVQHRVLSSEEVPLVFFDEFDSHFEERPLGWLKYFLAPMQDGVFRGRASDYRIGRAFFVFAGGTSPSFAEFKGSLKEKAAKAVKLPDFVSRLHGFLDIQSINPPENAAADQPQKQQRMIKRALLLRSLLLTHAKSIIQKQGDDDVPDIDDRLIDALLNAGRYEHGLRSMESVVRMSKWIDGEFIPASLPAKSLLEMHVTGLTIERAGAPETIVEGDRKPRRVRHQLDRVRSRRSARR